MADESDSSINVPTAPPDGQPPYTPDDRIPPVPVPGNNSGNLPGQGPVSTIHTERYTSWNGTLHSRGRIVGNTMYQGFRHILSNKWVKLLLVLTWVFNVVFPLLFASFGMMNLMQESGDDSGFDDWEEAYDLVRDYEVGFPLSRNIEEGGIAIYNITVMNSGERTDIVEVNIVHVDHGWSAILVPLTEEEEEEDNDTRSDEEEEDDEGENGLSFALAAGELATFGLVVMPPEGMVSGKGIVALEAQSLGAILVSEGYGGEEFEVGSEIYAVTLVGHSEGSPYHFVMSTDSRTMSYRTVKAGETVSFPVTINNTGSVDETFVIQVEGLPKKWYYTLEGLDELPDNVAKGEMGVYLQPGENRTFNITYDTPKYPGKSTVLGVSAYSVNDPSLSGGVITIVEAKNIPDRDQTNEVVAGLHGFLFMLFALFLAAVAGSRAISEDLAQKSFTIYFSRPIKKPDYIAIKFGSVAAVMCLGTMIPVLVTYLGLILFSSIDAQYMIDHLWVWGAIILHSLLIVTVFTSLSLAYSSLTVRRFYAAFALVVTYMISAIISDIVRNVFHERTGTAISISHSIDVVATKIFDVPDSHYSYEWTYNLLALLTIVVIGISIVMLKVWKTELSE